MYFVLQKFPGRNKHQRCRNLFLDIQAFYKAHNTESRFDNLKTTMFSGKKGFKLRAKGAEARGLVPWAKQLAETRLDNSKPVEQTIIEMARHLDSCYQNLATAQFDTQSMALHSRQFCLLSVALEQLSSSKLWKTKPKLHFTQELCELTDDNPSLCWCYRDEDFGGTLASLARSRGGHNVAAAMANRALLKFLAKHNVPTIIQTFVCHGFSWQEHPCNV